MRQIRPADDRSAWRLILTISVALTFVRLAVLAATPLELYPDEAQYWLWSRDLAFGYFSKPPMVAWLIRLTTAVGGDAEPYVRAAAPLLHALAGLLVFDAGRRLYGRAAGLAGFAVYQLAPGVTASSFVISTDAPLMAFLTLALWAYVLLLQGQGRGRLAAAAGLGAALGLAFLSKYAALYAVLGLALHLAIERDARRAWRPLGALAAIAAFAVIAAPNVIWNAAHGFATVSHTASNADWSGRRFDVAGLGEFVASQFGVFGIVPFAVLLLAAVRWGRSEPPDRLLWTFIAPPLVVTTVIAFVSRANANWAAAAYGPAAILVGALLVRWRAWRWLAIGVGHQGLIIALVLALAVQPQWADRIGAANSLKRLRGWRQLTMMVGERARTESLSAVAFDDRFAFNEAAYYGRDYFGRAGPPLRIWVRGKAPENQAELAAALTPQDGARVLAVSIEGRSTAAMAADFARVSGREIVSVQLDAKHRRRADMMLGEGFEPRPRP